MAKSAAIMQPYFMPYIGYFQLIATTDEFVFFDTPQYERHGWMNRNRILNPDAGFTYINVPIKRASRETAIKDIEIDNSQGWREKIIRQLELYKTAPFYASVMDLLGESLLGREYIRLAELNVRSALDVCAYLGLAIDPSLHSENPCCPDRPLAPDEWALEICRHRGYTHYVNAIGGKQFFDRDKYAQASIDIQFLRTRPVPYRQFGNDHVPFLSIIDVMMFNSPAAIRDMLDEYDFE
jgi:hypothetical protein